MNDFSRSPYRILLPVLILLVGAFAILSAMSVVVESGNVGVVTTLGAVQPNALPEGFHLKKPFLDQVHQIDIRLTASNAQATAASHR